MSRTELFPAVFNVDVAQQLLPIWTDWGIADVSCSIHSLGTSFITLLGNKLGYVSVSEFPVPRLGQYANTGDEIRCDSVWFERKRQTPILIAEFERYNGISDQRKLEGKVKNLLLAHQRWGKEPQWLVLAYWTQGLASLPTHTRFENIIQHGFETPERLRVPGTNKGRLLCLQFINEEHSQKYFRLTKIIQRGSNESQ